MSLSLNDPNSYANSEVVKVTNLHLRLEADFDQHVLRGEVELTLDRVDRNANIAVLDAQDLEIHSVKDISTDSPLEYALHEPGFLGSKFEVFLPENGSKTLRVTVKYSSSSNAAALQWLEPEQTVGKSHPYLYSITHTRSIIPLQDTSGVKAPYSAEIVAPAELTVLMSAQRIGEPELLEDGKKRVHHFEQKIPIPSYLIAIAAGKLEARQIGPRSSVWSEKEFIDLAAAEFSDTEFLLQTAEEICGPYVWGTYDILVLPPCYLAGGMENPCLTFVTPTILAGDKSLTNVIAHEIAHSWTGNLVTNKNYEHAWLNEGFTVFTERKILGRLEGEPTRHFKTIGGIKDLEYELSVRGNENPITRLVLDMSGVDPTDAFSIVMYEKGNLFLWYLEQTVGGPDKMEPFLRQYYDHFKYQSITSDQFKAFFLDYFKNEPRIGVIQWDDWFYKPGMPNYVPDLDTSLQKPALELKNKWIQWDDQSDQFAPEDLSNFKTDQKIEFISLLLKEAPLSHAKLDHLDKVYDLNKVRNNEIRFRWLRLGLLAHWEPAVPNALSLLTEQGRLKYLKPIYRDLAAWNDKYELALETFNKNRPSMTKMSIQVIEGIFKDTARDEKAS